VTLTEKIKHLFKSNNGITYKLYFRIKHLNSKGVMELEHNPSRTRQYQVPVNNPKTDFTEVIKNLSIRLKTLYDLTTKLNSVPIFISQRTDRWKVIDNTVYSYNSTNHYLKEKLISDKVLEFCESRKMICVDIFTQLNFKNTDTYDLVHTTPSGATKVSNVIFENIKGLNF
jgi:predicted transcriptional regulator